MALLVAGRAPVPQGQVTSTIYGHLGNGRYDEAIQILEYELQVADLADLHDHMAALSVNSVALDT